MAWNMAAYNDGKANGSTFYADDATSEQIIREFKHLEPSLSQGEYGLGFTHATVERLAAVNHIAAARFFLETEADSRVIEEANRLVADEMAEWILDPEVQGVVGLVGRPSNGGIARNSAYIVVYLNGTTPDWETTNHFDDALRGDI